MTTTTDDLLALGPKMVQAWARVVIAWVDASIEFIDEMNTSETSIPGVANGGRTTIPAQPAATKLVATPFRHEKGHVITPAKLTLAPDHVAAGAKTDVVITVSVNANMTQGEYEGAIKDEQGTVLRDRVTVYIVGVPK